MNEWLTTGERIDRLKVGEVAIVRENLSGASCIKILEDKVIFDEYMYKWKDGQRFQLNDFTTKLKWEIIPKLPKYVSFEEAIKAFFEGKKIWVEHNGKKDWFADVLNHKERDVSPSFGEMKYGKWTIEEES